MINQKIAILTDSGSDVPYDIAKEMNIFVNTTDKKIISDFFTKYPEMLTLKKEHFLFKELVDQKIKILNDGVN